MRIYLHGRDNVGWSIDSDRMNTERFLKDIGHVITNNVITADVVHSVWWNQLLEKKYFFLRLKKRIITTATNNIDPSANPDYKRAKKFVSTWVVPNRKQLEILKSDNVKAVYQPFYVDEHVFMPLNKTREVLSAELGVDFLSIRDKFLIGSFQRDTVGSDLKSAKWQKGPELLVKIVSSLPQREKFVLVLAGPRRHYVISECEKLGIPYIFVGHKPKPGIDDIDVNTIKVGNMPLLYNFVDCYLMTSRSEGGPKCVLESSFCKTMIFSTDVGLAPDILDKGSIYTESDCAVENLSKLIKGETSLYSELVPRNYRNAMNICSYEASKKRWKEIYAAFK